MSPSRRLNGLAHHEAGHAVVAHHYGRELLRVSIDPPEDRGRTDCRVSADHPWIAEEEVRIILAGGRAALILDPELQEDAFGAVDDEGKAMTIISEHLVPDDFSKPFAEVEDEREALNDRLAAETRELLSRPEMWRAVSALAAALKVRLVLSGQEAMEIIRPAWRGSAGGASKMLRR